MITSFRHDQREKDRKRRIFAALFVGMVIVFLFRGPLGVFFGGTLHVIGRPFWGVTNFMGDVAGETRALFSSKIALEAENQKLRETLDLVVLDAYGQERLRQENTELQALLLRKPEFSFMLGRVLAAPPLSPYDTLVIDAGTNHGVFVGMEAFTDGDFKLGVVTRVFKRSAVVTLFSSPDNTFPVLVGTSSVPANIFGVGGGNFRISLPKGVEIAVGDVVETPALQPEYVGVVEAISRPEGSSLQTLFVKTPFSIAKLRWVYLAVPQDNSRVSKVNLSAPSFE
jgi:cell shape-determining protein MreC